MNANGSPIRPPRKPAFAICAALLGAILSGAASAPGRAACACVCVDGLNRPLCSEVTDIEPQCPPRVCPDAPRSTPPLDPGQLPPTGTRNCTMEYLYNRYAQRYEWRQVCE